ncbi:7 transmembrane receptor [Lymphocystis disease virus 3]|uniref:7 transmembrane receptor n=1 Tax=Lymphocystis disease virus 3 TaxID=2560566 RepID=A0A1B2RVT3_9VIRU|nr:7 transmembrane receptor [Lymphocystis disease virus Sa]AOC55113.1 7 transmembrane receptor [Lymphocystis disease virus 3]
MEDYYEDYNSSYYEEYDERYAPCTKEDVYAFHSIFIPTVYSLMFVAGYVGNIAAIVIYCREPTVKKTVTNICILNLVISDLLIISTLPLWAFEVNHGWHLGTFMCKIASFIYTFNLTLGAFLLVYISVDRYCVIVQNLQVKTRPLWFILIWSCAALFSLPELIFSAVEHVHYHPRIGKICTFVYTVESTQYLRSSLECIEIVIQFVIPAGVIIFCYGAVVYKLKTTTISKKWYTLSILMALVTIFFITQLPFTIVKIYRIVDVFHNIITTCRDSRRLDYALSTTHCLALLHVCVNPLLYTCVGSVFKKRVINYFDRLLNQTDENAEL